MSLQALEEPSQVSKTEADQDLLQESPRLQELGSSSLNKTWYQSKQESYSSLLQISGLRA